MEVVAADIREAATTMTEVTAMVGAMGVVMVVTMVVTMVVVVGGGGMDTEWGVRVMEVDVICMEVVVMAMVEGEMVMAEGVGMVMVAVGGVGVEVEAQGGRIPTSLIQGGVTVVMVTIVTDKGGKGKMSPFVLIT
jgi:hypothetical protein